MSERRKIERLGPLVIRADFARDEQRHRGYMTNVSEAGAFLATGEELRKGETLELHIHLPWGLGEHDVRASVVWRSADIRDEPRGFPRGVGLNFIELGQEAREAVRRYMQRFYEILSQMEQRGLNEVLVELTRQANDVEARQTP